LAIAYIIFVAAVVLAGMQIGSRIVDQANSLAQKLPQMLATFEAPVPAQHDAFSSLKAEVMTRVRNAFASRSGELLSALPAAGLKFISVASDLIYLVIIPILAFFFLKDGGTMREHVLDLVAEGPRRVLLDDVMADIHLLLAHYMRALVLLSLAAFTAYAIFFSVMDVPYGILLAALACLLEFIPMLGPLTASLAIVLVAAVTGSNVPIIIVFLVAFRMFQDYILSPHLMGKGVELNPLLVLFGVFAGAEVAGIPGTFLSVPVLALVRILYLRIRKARLSSQLTPSGAAMP
jgi:predicted PurR-regulated permease PerM